MCIFSLLIGIISSLFGSDVAKIVFAIFLRFLPPLIFWRFYLAPIKKGFCCIIVRFYHRTIGSSLSRRLENFFVPLFSIAENGFKKYSVEFHNVRWDFLLSFIFAYFVLKNLEVSVLELGWYSHVMGDIFVHLHDQLVVFFLAKASRRDLVWSFFLDDHIIC